MTGKRVLLIVNRNARRGAESIDPVTRRLEAKGFKVRPCPIDALDRSEQDLAALGEDVDLIVICGGDGSVSSAARLILATGLPMGIIPLGTANDLARTIGIPADPLAAADMIADGHQRQIDVGTVNGRTFFNVASIGLSSDLAQTLDPATKKRFGRLSYAICALKVFSKATRFKAWIKEDGIAIKVRTYQIAVGNGVLYGGGNVVEQSAAIDDGRLDLYSLELQSLWKLILMVRAFRLGTHGAWSEVRTARCVEFDIETSKPMPVNADGEIVTSTPAHFKVLPDAISVFVPRQT